MTAEADDAEAARKLFAGPCDFVWGVRGAGDAMPPGKLPEAAFVGRSNAGKSSLINALTGRKTLARVSQTPGATRQINFFNLGGRLMLADLPGYGFAKVSKLEAATWQALILGYLQGRGALRRVLLLIDARRGLMESDSAVLELLGRAGVATLLVLTKLDEVPPGEQAAVLNAALAQAKARTVTLQEVIATSARTGHGVPALRAHLHALAAPPT